MKALRLNLDIYSVEAILQATNDYREFAKICVVEAPMSAEVQFSNCKYDETTTVLEFENYLIGLENA